MNAKFLAESINNVSDVKDACRHLRTVSVVERDAACGQIHDACCRLNDKLCHQYASDAMYFTLFGKEFVKALPL